MAAVEKVYALHDFDAENPDEVSFKAGEAVIIVERDDAYGDGWWQGTNLRGETGLFPFSYTTFDAELAKGSALMGEKGEPQAATNGKVMNSTMADIDEALAGLRTGNGNQAGGISSKIAADRRSISSERTGDYSMGGTDENGGNAEDEYEARARARAALAVNAAKDQEAINDAEKAEQARMKAQAQRTFEEEEEKQRQLLLQREGERKVAAAEGKLNKDEKPKVAPIPGLDMSDESDSEGSDAADYDDAIAATHAPLFGGIATSSSGGKLAASDSVQSGGNDRTVQGDVIPEEQQHQRRSLSPIPSASGHSQGGQTALFAGASAAAAAGVTAGSIAATHQNAADQATANPVAPGAFPEQSHSYDPPNLVSSKARSSMNSEGPNTGASNFGGAQNGVGVIPASTSFSRPETPKNQTALTQASPTPSVLAGRPAGPGGDPHDWTVEQVVEWGRSKGWDEAQIVSKFAEHEISGDVLMEMDVNILKEIDITAFGKRFQVANAIKDLKKSLAGGDVSTTSWSAMPDPALSPASATQNSFQIQQQRGMQNQSEPPSSQGHQYGMPAAAAVAGMGAAAAGMGAATILSRSSSIVPNHQFEVVQSSAEQRESGNNGWIQSPMHALDREANHDGEANRSLYSETKSVRNRNVSQEDSSVPPSPRKRESISSASGKASGDRTSFFANFQSNKGRKPPPKVQSAGVADGENGRGTFSRLGFSRIKAGATTPSEPPSPGQDLRNRISLPTSSPTYDAMGDTARRNRVSQHSNGSSAGINSNRGNMPVTGMGGNQKRASVGSAGPNATDWHAPTNRTTDDSASSEGAVMVRIRPVDHEGWMRKKGERYNTWKPRYLALKGSDLVLLRDPSAAKIKGYVSMKGYKVIADENTNPGKYGFKILHENEKPHYFSSDDALVVRDWMKALMKATIDRDTSLPVISSYNNATISLKEAQKMNPPPRPPSPTSVARAQRARARGNKDELTAKDASVLMGVQKPTENGRAWGFIAQDRVSPVDREWQEQKRAIGIDQSHQELTKKSQEGSDFVLPGVKRPQGRGVICLSPVGQVAPWILREETETDSNRTRTVLPKRVAPLRTHGLLPDLGSLPVLEQANGSGLYTSDVLSPPPPPPLPKSAQSDTMGCADLPPPPPPSHSPDHRSRIHSLISRKKAPSHWPEFTLPTSPKPTSPKDGATSLAPSPISKGLDSASSYPTVSDSAAPTWLKPISPLYLSSSKLSKKVGKSFLSRPKSAGDGQGQRGSIRSPSSLFAPMSVGGAKNKFIVFSGNRGSSNDQRTSLSNQDRERQVNVTTSPSNYSNNDSVFVESPFRTTENDFQGSITTYLNTIPTLPKTAALTTSLQSPTPSSDAKSHYRRSCSFDGLSKPRKVELRQETMNKPSWFKFTRDREKKRMMEVESEEKIAEAEREIHDLDEDHSEEVYDIEQDDNAPSFSQLKYHQETMPSSPSSQKDTFGEQGYWLGSVGSSPRSGGGASIEGYRRQRCHSDQPYPGLLSLSPTSISRARSPLYQV